MSAVLIIAGALLALLGVTRLTGRALHTMPGVIAFCVLVVGVVVAVFGAAYPRLVSEPEASGPSVPLEPLPAPDDTTRAEPGTISGAVRTADGEPAVDRPVELRRFERTDAVDEQTTVTDERGRFSFTDLPMAPDTAYTVHTEHAGVAFRSELIVLGPHMPGRQLDLVVADPTTDPDVLEIGIDSTVLVGDLQGAQVVQVITLRNDGDGAFTAGLRLPLLSGASELEPRRGLDRTRLTVIDDELVSLAPVLPGEHEILYTYVVPVPPEGIDLHRTIRYATDRVEILVSGALNRVEGELRAEGPVEVGAPGDTEARDYLRFSATDLEPGERLEATVLVAETGRALRTGLVAAAVVAAFAILAYPLVRRRRRTMPVPDPEEPVSVPEGE